MIDSQTLEAFTPRLSFGRRRFWLNFIIVGAHAGPVAQADRGTAERGGVEPPVRSLNRGAELLGLD